jgi:hypothetical protein
MPFTPSQMRLFGITDLSQYAMAFSSNISLNEASLESIMDSKFVEQLRELIEDSIARTIE